MMQSSPAFCNLCFIYADDLNSDYDDFIRRVVAIAIINNINEISPCTNTTMLMNACYNLSEVGVELLLAAGAKVNLKDAHQRTCLDYLASSPEAQRLLCCQCSYVDAHS